MTDEGKYTPKLTSRERADLRGEAHHLQPLVHVGGHGLTPAVIQSIDDALRTKELVKIQLGRNADVKPKDAAQALAIATGADIVQVIGRTATLYRQNPEIEGKSGDVPPWRR